MKPALCIVVVALVSLVSLTQRDERIQYFPTGRDTGMIVSTHPLKRDRTLRVQWAYDPRFGEAGWCIYAAAPGERPRFHLVLGGDGETTYGTRPEWWGR